MHLGLWDTEVTCQGFGSVGPALFKESSLFPTQFVRDSDGSIPDDLWVDLRVVRLFPDFPRYRPRS